jgi:hypothetical protein
MGLNKLIKAMKTELLVTPLHEQWLGRNSNVELSDDVADFVRSELVAKQRKRSATWSSSSLGYCERKHVYQYLGVARERGVDSDLASIFIHGTWTHLKWQAMGYMAGWLAQTEVPCEIPSLHYTGTIDGILIPELEAGWELKSINARGFQRVLSYGVDEKHQRQIHGYMLATGLKKWSVVYEEKNTQQYKEFVVTFDHEMADSVVAELGRLNAAVQDRALPPQLPGCTTRSSSEFKQCPFRDRCMEGSWPHQKLVIRRSKSSTSGPTPTTT